MSDVKRTSCRHCGRRIAWTPETEEHTGQHYWEDDEGETSCETSLHEPVKEDE